MDPSYFIFVHPCFHQLWGASFFAYQAVAALAKTESGGWHTFCPPTATGPGSNLPNQLIMVVSVPAIPPATSLLKSSLGWKEFGITAGSYFLGPAHCCPLTSIFPGLWGSGE